MTETDRKGTRRFTIVLARQLLSLLEDVENWGSGEDLSTFGRLVMCLSKQIYDFGLSLAEEENAEGNRNADGNADVVTC